MAFRRHALNGVGHQDRKESANSTLGRNITIGRTQLPIAAQSYKYFIDNSKKNPKPLKCGKI